jgi:diguanylate cyclase (GGDEF)-like protein
VIAALNESHFKTYPAKNLPENDSIMKPTSKACYELPALPVAVMNLLRDLSKDGASLNAIAAIVQEDVGLCVKILSVANSPAYRSRRPIETIGHAVSWLGKEATTAIALSLSMNSLIQNRGELRQLFDKVWLHAFVQAIAMEEIAYQTKKWNSSKAYVTGLLFDIGKFAQLSKDPLAFSKLEEQYWPNIESRLQAEVDAFGKPYTSIGSEICALMDLPKDFSLAAEMHLSSLQQISQIPDAEVRDLIAATCFASEVGGYFGSDDKLSCLLRIKSIAGEFFGICSDTITVMVQSIEQRVHEKAGLFQVQVEMLPNNQQLMGMAVEQLTRQLLVNAVPSDPGVEAIRLQRECCELREALVRTEERASRDPLTRCFNREYFEGRLKERVRQAELDGTPVGILMMDVDKFKLVNDTIGHLEGDEVLLKLAEQLEQVCGDRSIAGRFGGDEFLVLSTVESEAELAAIGKAIADGFREAINLSVKVSLSIGGVLAHSLTGEAELERKILRVVDSAMYTAKRSGGDRLVIAEWSDRNVPSSQSKKGPKTPVSTGC